MSAPVGSGFTCQALGPCGHSSMRLWRPSDDANPCPPEHQTGPRRLSQSWGKVCLESENRPSSLCSTKQALTPRPFSRPRNRQPIAREVPCPEKSLKTVRFMNNPGYQVHPWDFILRIGYPIGEAGVIRKKEKA